MAASLGTSNVIRMCVRLGARTLTAILVGLTTAHLAVSGIAQPQDEVDPCKPCQRLESKVGKGLFAGGHGNKAARPHSTFAAIRRWSLEELEEALGNGRACLEAATLRPLDREVLSPVRVCVRPTDEVERLLSELETAEAEVKQVTHVGGLLSSAWFALAPLPENLGRRAELPPSEVESECDRLWEDLMGLAASVKARPGSRNSDIGSAAAAEKAAEGFRAAIERLCTLRRRILDSGCSAEGLSYFTWTATWDQYQAVKNTLSGPPFRELCR